MRKRDFPWSFFFFSPSFNTNSLKRGTSGNNRATHHHRLLSTTSLWLPDSTLKVWCNLKRAFGVCGGGGCTCGTQVKIWRVSCHQTQTLHYVTFPLGFADCVIISFCNDNQSSIITFQVCDLNDIVRAPKNKLTFAAPLPFPPWFQIWQELHLIYFSLRPDTPWYWFDTDHLLCVPFMPSTSESEHKNRPFAIWRLSRHKNMLKIRTGSQRG